MLAAWRMAEQELHDRKAALLLAGPNSDCPPVRAWRKALHYPEDVFICGTIPPKSVPAIMRSADVILIPSLTEGLPNVGMEGGSSGCALVGSNVGGIPELIEDGVHGRLVKAGHESSWAETLKELAAEPDSVSRMGLKARERMEMEFDSTHYGARVFDFYKRVLNTRCRS